MAEEPGEHSEEQDPNYLGKGMAAGSGLGAVVAAVLASDGGDMGHWVVTGICVGASLGLAAGAVLERLRKRSGK
ncbi:MAG: hypothetical protein O2954_01870 [bacterium]|nr:hypothetical protein [bacterium]